MKFIWAFDPTQKPREARKILREVRSWAQKMNASVEPVCVITESLKDLPPEMRRHKQLDLFWENMVAIYMDQLDAKCFAPPKILKSNSHSQRKKAHQLSTYADSQKVDIIFLNTHAKSTWNPFALGGFSESLLTLSKTSLLLVNPQVKKTGKPISEIFFPTDFEAPSKKSLERLIPLARMLNAKITLFNQIETTLFYAANMGSPYVIYDAEGLIRELTRARTSKGHKWEKRLLHHDVESSLWIARQKYRLARDITEKAEQSDVDLIALVNQTQPLAERVLGSTPRNVLVRAHCPVLVLR